LRGSKFLVWRHTIEKTLQAASSSKAAASFRVLLQMALGRRWLSWRTPALDIPLLRPEQTLLFCKVPP